MGNETSLGGNHPHLDHLSSRFQETMEISVHTIGRVDYSIQERVEDLISSAIDYDIKSNFISHNLHDKYLKNRIENLLPFSVNLVVNEYENVEGIPICEYILCGPSRPNYLERGYLYNKILRCLRKQKKKHLKDYYCAIVFFGKHNKSLPNDIIDIVGSFLIYPGYKEDARKKVAKIRRRLTR